MEESADAMAGMLAQELPETLDRFISEQQPLAIYWTPACEDHGPPSVVLGSPHGGPIFRLTVERLDGDAAHDAWHHLADSYDEDQAGFWDMGLEEFRASLKAGHLYDGYRPYEGGPGWQHRSTHDRWREELKIEAEGRQSEGAT